MGDPCLYFLSETGVEFTKESKTGGEDAGGFRREGMVRRRCRTAELARLGVRPTVGSKGSEGKLRLTTLGVISLGTFRSVMTGTAGVWSVDKARIEYNETSQETVTVTPIQTKQTPTAVESPIFLGAV